MSLDPITELEGLVDALEAAGIDYAVCGGLALAVHGHPRATMDEIDMSPQAVAARLDSVRALYRLALYLGRFKTPERAAQDDSASSPRSDGE